MGSCTRRSFLKTGAAGATGIALLGPAASTRAAGANERVTVGVIGCGTMGRNHAQAMASMSEVQLAYMCDPDDRRLHQTAKEAKAVKIAKDLRTILDDNSVDAVIIATPDHWHTPAALLAMEAGKHVYLEKPCSHNLREGQLLVEAVRRSNRVVQHGTQSRSSRGVIEAMRLLRTGIIGEVLAAKAWNIQRRVDIGHAVAEEPPAELDYDLWVGPAEMVPFQKNRYHYTWHWWYNFGTGGIGNDGTHELDYARRALSEETHPTRVSGTGTKVFFDDDQQFPDTMQVTFEYPGDGKVGSRRLLVYEQRLWSPAQPYSTENGAEFYGTEGTMFLSKNGKVQVFGPDNKPLDVKVHWAEGLGYPAHRNNWIDCIKSGKSPNADAVGAHRTVTLVHLGNIVARLGRSVQFDPVTERILNDDEANGMLSRTYRADNHWAIPKGA